MGRDDRQTDRRWLPGTAANAFSLRRAVLPAERSEMGMMSSVPRPSEGQGARGPALQDRNLLPRGFLLEPRQLMRAGSAQRRGPRPQTTHLGVCPPPTAPLSPPLSSSAAAC